MLERGALHYDNVINHAHPLFTQSRTRGKSILGEASWQLKYDPRFDPGDLRVFPVSACVNALRHKFELRMHA